MSSAMRTIAPSEQETESAADPGLDDAVERLLALMTAVGRRRSLRDPIAAACEMCGAQISSVS